MLYAARWKKITVDQSKVLKNQLFRFFGGPPGIYIYLGGGPHSGTGIGKGSGIGDLQIGPMTKPLYPVFATHQKALKNTKIAKIPQKYATLWIMNVPKLLPKR